MNNSTLKLLIISFICCILLGSAFGDPNNDSFSFKELELASEVSVPSVQYIPADDGVSLAYREYEPEIIDAVLVFYHGGGAYSNAGYQFIGDGLSKRFNILVITPDIRGHGDSGGSRGDASKVEQVFDDIGTLIRLVKTRYPQKAIFLGGHSSGGGLVLNYSTYKKREKTSGYLFLSPQLGFRSQTEIKGNPNPFTTVITDLFVQNAMSGTEGHSQAVFFNYSQEILQTTKNIAAITVNMANAITPHSPVNQIKKLDLPTAVWIGEKDEIFDSKKVIALFKKHNPESYTNIIEGEKHLSILINASDYMGPWIRKTTLGK
jgi:alpha-beta hydrolase superfamily lysophospholipase